MSYYLGIDLHKRSATWAIINEEKEVLGRHTSKVTPLAIDEAVRKLVTDPQHTKAVLEPVCGWLWVEEQLRGLGLDVAISNPLKTRSIADSKRKNDEIDALTLADLLRVDYLPTSYVAPPDIRRLRTQVRMRSHLVQMRTSLTNRTKGVVTARGLHSLIDTCMTQRGYKEALEQQQTDVVRMLEIGRMLDAHIRVMDRELDEERRPTRQLHFCEPFPPSVQSPRRPSSPKSATSPASHPPVRSARTRGSSPPCVRREERSGTAGLPKSAQSICVPRA
jgi:transposase